MKTATYEKALFELVQHIVTEYGGDTARFYEDMRRAKENRVAEPAPEPRSFEVWENPSGTITSGTTTLPVHLLSRGWKQITVTEIPPGWKLVKEDEPKGRPLPEGVPQPPDGFDYWGVGPLPHRGSEGSAAIAQWHPTSAWWNRDGVGYDPESHYALARGTALHAANFGEVDDTPDMIPLITRD